jgi:hypothetical protein
MKVTFQVRSENAQIKHTATPDWRFDHIFELFDEMVLIDINTNRTLVFHCDKPPIDKGYPIFLALLACGIASDYKISDKWSIELNSTKWKKSYQKTWNMEDWITVDWNP